MPLATYLLYNYISTLPKEILESAFIDGASHFTIFVRLILPLFVPALASFAIFQFLWVWNDYLVSLIFLGITDRSKQVITMRIAGPASGPHPAALEPPPSPANRAGEGTWFRRGSNLPRGTPTLSRNGGGWRA